MNYPPYVFLTDGKHKTALRLRGNYYYRDAGRWEIAFKEIDGQLLVDESAEDSYAYHLNNLSLIPCSKEEWRKDNKGYV